MTTRKQKQKQRLNAGVLRCAQNDKQKKVWRQKQIPSGVKKKGHDKDRGSNNLRQMVEPPVAVTVTA
jgi:hypothetical protein